MYPLFLLGRHNYPWIARRASTIVNKLLNSCPHIRPCPLGSISHTLSARGLLIFSYSFKEKKEMSAEKKPFSRLPTNVIPLNYAIELKPDLEKFTFAGRVSITLQVNAPSKTVCLNSADIEVSNVTCGDQVGTVSYQKEDERVSFEFPQEITSSGATVLNIDYTGILNDQMKGFYRSKYTRPDEPEVERYTAVTQFEAADARRAFPCWDEPAHKATFDVTLVVPKNLIALSNMDVREAKESGDTKTVVFNRTPIMSTYLLAFIVGEYDYIEDKDSNGVLVRVYTPLGKKEQGRFALNIATKTLPFYTEYFKVPYPLPKIDLIAIPDFAAGAMENWGLVTYRERLLLAKDDSPISTKQIVAIVVGHELAHQWFGNLVTMEWWTDLWLNEGFASWIEYLCVDYCHPEFEIWTQFLAQDYAQALGLDALSNSHPIEVEVGPPSEVEEIFDAISYSKGASVIRMLHNWIGDDDFCKGMNDYLTKYQYKNTKTVDLWSCLADASGKPVMEVMKTWTQQMGYPVLTVDAKQEGTKRVLTISQKKFCADGNITGFEDKLWQVPVTIATSKNPAAYRFVLDQRSTTITLEGLQPNDWIKVNPGQYGFYRVNYTPAAFTPLLTALSSDASSLPPQDRLGLLNDAFALARAGVGSTVEVLRLLKSFSSETNFTVWQNLVSNLSLLDRLAGYSDFSSEFNSYAQSLFSGVVSRLGWDPKDTDTPLDKMMRGLVLKQYCYYGNKDAITEAQRRFVAHVEKSSLIPSDLKDLIFSTCMANGNDETFDQLIKFHDETNDSDERSRIYRVLGRGKTEPLIKRCLEFGLTDKVRNQDAWGPIASAAGGSRLGRQLTWQYLRDNWDTYKTRFQGSFLLSRVIEIVTIGFIGEDKAIEVEEFFKTNPVPTAERVIRQSLEAIRNNTQWLKRDQDSIREWLKNEAQS